MKFKCPIHGELSKVEVVHVKAPGYRSEPRCSKCIIDLFEKLLPPLTKVTDEPIKKT